MNAPQLTLFSSPRTGSRWRVTGHRGAFRVYEVTAIDGYQFTMQLIEDTSEVPHEIGLTFEVESEWFRVRGEIAAAKEGAVREV